MFLAQVPRQDTFGDIFGGLLGQIPGFLIVQICLAATLLIAGIVFFTYRRRKRAEAAKASAPPPPGFVPAPESEISSPAAYTNYDTGDLPDLDLLVDRSSLVIDTVPPPRPARPGVVSVNLHTGASVEAKEVLSILRDENDGRLIVQIGDTAYRTLVDRPEAKKHFAQIMKELAEVVAQPDSAAGETALASAPEAELQPVQEPDTVDENQPSLRDLVEPEPQTPTPSPVKKTAPPPPVTPDGRMPGDLAAYKLDNYPVDIKRGGILRPKKFESAPVPELNIAAAIEAYLQYKLQHTPEYAGRSIHVHSAPGGGVAIEVDGSFYDAVGDVAETDVRQFLSETIQEWQERQ